jgi:hypothetical protein
MTNESVGLDCPFFFNYESIEEFMLPRLILAALFSF